MVVALFFQNRKNMATDNNYIPELKNEGPL